MSNLEAMNYRRFYMLALIGGLDSQIRLKMLPFFHF